MANPMLESACGTVEKQLWAKGFIHLRVRVHGKHLIIYSEYEAERKNRARLTPIKRERQTAHTLTPR